MKSTRIVVQKDRIVSVSVPVYYFQFKGDNVVYAECPSLHLTTYGNNLKNAKTMFDDTFNLWVKTVNEDGDAKEILENLGWKFTKTKVLPKEKSFKVPIELLANKTVNLQIPIGV
ncbi:MAG: hypothetical protein LBD98_00800 [Endomicrobium sp.]|jgi:hypothetical protein|nr:hypothetical protein [Endomicrobium sp.]